MQKLQRTKSNKNLKINLNRLQKSNQASAGARTKQNTLLGTQPNSGSSSSRIPCTHSVAGVPFSVGMQL
eukprot:42834-Amphidinium_carterae.1